MLYLESNTIRKEDSNNLLTPDIIKYLNDSLSKLSIAILKELYNSPQIQQKTLAANIHTSPSSLSNIITRLEAIQPQLIKTERVGRSKYYALTEIAELFVTQELLPKTAKIRPFTPYPQEDLTNSTLRIIYQFQKTAGQDWEILFDDMLSGNTQTAIANQELNDLYVDFINNVTQLKILHQTSSINEILTTLGNSILIRRLEHYLNDTLKNYYILEPLFKLAKQDYEMAAMSIDYIFAEIYPSYFPLSVSLNSPKDTLFSEEQYLKIFHELVKMFNEFNVYHGDKAKILEHWKTKYCSTNLSLTYIAEKCSNILAQNLNNLTVCH